MSRLIIHDKFPRVSLKETHLFMCLLKVTGKRCCKEQKRKIFYINEHLGPPKSLCLIFIQNNLLVLTVDLFLLVIISVGQLVAYCYLASPLCECGMINLWQSIRTKLFESNRCFSNAPKNEFLSTHRNNVPFSKWNAISIDYKRVCRLFKSTNFVLFTVKRSI